MKFLVAEIGKEYKIGSEDWNDNMFCGQRTKWIHDEKGEKNHIDVDQERGIDDLAEVIYDKKLDPDLACDVDLHHQFRSGVGAVHCYSHVLSIKLAIRSLDVHRPWPHQLQRT